MKKNYFVTWNKQVGSSELAVKGAEADEFLMEHGGRIYDFTSTSFQTSFGHSCEPIRRRIHAQLDTMPIASPKSSFALKSQVSERLLDFLGLESRDSGGKIFYTVSGSEAVENALKIARHASGRPVVLARRRSYHGASLGAMSVSGDWRSAGHLNFVDGTVRIPEPDDDPDGATLESIITATGAERIAALIVETISGVNGVIVPPQTWWDAVTRLCNEHRIFLICDEVLAGFGRTGRPFAFQHFGIRPDLVTMSKGITGGYIPFGAVFVAPTLAARYDDEVLACGLTNYGHPLGLAALDSVMELLTDSDFLAAKKTLEQHFDAELLETLALPQVSGIRSKGLLAAIEFHGAAPSWQACLDRGLYLVTRDQSVILAPPFISSPERLARAFRDLRALISEGPAQA